MVLVSNKGAGRAIVRVRGCSSTYDVPDFTRLTKKGAVRLREARASAPSQRVQVVRLRLTVEGRKRIASCEARALRVEAGGASDQGGLVRDTRLDNMTTGVPVPAPRCGGLGGSND